MRCLRLAFAVVALVMAISGVLSAEQWNWQDPAGTAVLNPSMTVMCNGTSDCGTDQDLVIRVYRDGVFKNHGDGDYIAMTHDWEGDVAPPSGGFGEGEGMGKLWKSSQNPAADPELCSGTWTFDDQM